MEVQLSFFGETSHVIRHRSFYSPLSLSIITMRSELANDDGAAFICAACQHNTIRHAKEDSLSLLTDKGHG